MTEVERQPAHSRRAALDETAQRLETELGEPQLATLALADVPHRLLAARARSNGLAGSDDHNLRPRPPRDRAHSANGADGATRDRRRTPPGAPRGGLEVLSASMRAPHIPSKRCGTRLVALMCASSPDPYAHRLAGTAHPRSSSRLASGTAGFALASATKSEPGPCSPPRGDTRRAAVARLPMRSAKRAPSPHVSAHRRRRRRPERIRGLPSPRTPASASNTAVCMDARETPAKECDEGGPPR
jgi:hypothetical protein